MNDKKDLPEEQKSISKDDQTFFYAEARESDFLDPDEVEKYEKLYPGFIKHYLEMMNAEQKHRHEFNKKQQEIEKIAVVKENENDERHLKNRSMDLKNKRIGIVFGSIIAVALIFVTVFLAEKNAEVAKVLITGVCTVIGIIVTGRYISNTISGKSKQEDEQNGNKEE